MYNKNALAKFESTLNMDIASKIYKMLKENKQIEEIQFSLKLSEFNLCSYLEYLYMKYGDLDPTLVMPKESVEKILEIFNDLGHYQLKPIHQEYGFGYIELRIMRGVFCRKPNYTKKSKSPSVEKQVDMFSLNGQKDDNEYDYLGPIKPLETLIEYLPDPRFQDAARAAFYGDKLKGIKRLVPLYFYEIPASMSKAVHKNESEQMRGHIVSPNEIYVGGDFNHMTRVFSLAQVFLEADDPRIWDFRRTKVVDYFFGNEFTEAEESIILFACMLHDVFDGGPQDEFNWNRKGMDKEHPYYHREYFKPLTEYITEEEFDLLCTIIEAHMGKWGTRAKEKFPRFDELKKMETVEDAYKFARVYRMVRIVQMSDLLASRDFVDVIPITERS